MADEQVTGLGLSGPRFAPFFEFIQSDASARPDDGQFTEFGLGGLARPPQSFLPKDAGGSASRPNDGDFTELGLGGARVPQVFLAKTTGRGILGRVTLSAAPGATLAYGRRYTIVPNVSLSLRPQGAAMIFAHRNSLLGTNRIDISTQGLLRYRRSGAHYAVVGFNQTVLTPFGFVTQRRRKSIIGSINMTVTPAAGLRFTQAPVRSYNIQARALLSITPSSQTEYEAGGVDYAIQATNHTSLTPSARISIVRETTYRIHGSAGISITPNAVLAKTTGAPQAFSIQGSVRLQVTPQGTMGLVTGVVNNYAISGSVRLTLVVNGVAMPLPAVPLDPDGAILETQPRTRRKLVRVFR